MRYLPDPSMTRTPAGTATPDPTAAMRPSRTSIVPDRTVPADAIVMIVTFRMANVPEVSAPRDVPGRGAAWLFIKRLSVAPGNAARAASIPAVRIKGLVIDSKD